MLGCTAARAIDPLEIVTARAMRVARTKVRDFMVVPSQLGENLYLTFA